MRPANNPFRSTAIERLSFEGASAVDLFEKWRACGMRGAIIGPHGSGKTTLLLELRSLMYSRGLDPLHVTFWKESGKTHRTPEVLPSDAKCVLIDGIDLCPSLLKRFNSTAGVLVTSHQETVLPTLYRCETSVHLLRSLSMKLQEKLIDQKLCETLLEQYEGNIREVFRELYDRER